MIFPNLLDKRVLIRGTFFSLIGTLLGKESTSFDEYNAWYDDFKPGKEEVLKTYQREPKASQELKFTEKDRQNVTETLQSNILSLVKAHPETKFYFFFTPYSIVYWDSLNQQKGIHRQIEAERVAMEQLLPYENVELYSFFQNFDLICDLNQYKDSGHYMDGVNELILEWIHDKQYQITNENYEEYLQEIEQFYSSYNYESIFD